MAYNKKELFEKARRIIKEKELLSLVDVFTFLGISSSTFYEYFPTGTSESNTLKEDIANVKANMRAVLRSKWKDSEQTALQIALYKLSALPEELEVLAPPKDNQQAGQIEVKIVKE